MDSAPVSSYAKIDMSLDDIIKLNKKDKKAEAAKRNKAPVKRLTATQKKRANVLKAKAKQAQASKNQTSKFPSNRAKKITNASVRGRLQRKTKMGMTSGGSVNAGRKTQTNKPKTPGPAKPLRGNARRQLTSQKRRGGANTQKSLGVRIQNSQKNQRNKRQQVIAKRRPGLQSIRGTGTKQSRGQTRSKQNNPSTRSNGSLAQNRRYNQQPRSQYGQQPRGRGQNQQQRSRGRRGMGRGSASGRTVTLY